MAILILSTSTIILATAATLLRAKETNPVERRVNRSLKRVMETGLPVSVPSARGSVRDALLPASARPSVTVQELSSPALA